MSLHHSLIVGLQISALSLLLQGCAKNEETASIDSQGNCTQKYINDHNSYATSMNTFTSCKGADDCLTKLQSAAAACRNFISSHGPDIRCKAEVNSNEIHADSVTVHNECSSIIKKAEALTPLPAKGPNITQVELSKLEIKILAAEKLQSVLDVKDLVMSQGKVMKDTEVAKDQSSCKIFPQTKEGLKLENGMRFEADGQKINYTMTNQAIATIIRYKLKKSKKTFLFMVCNHKENIPMSMKDFALNLQGLMGLPKSK